MYLVLSSFLFTIPVIFRKKAIRHGSFGMMVVSSLHHLLIKIGKRSMLLNWLDKLMIYGNGMISLKKTTKVTLIPWSICTFNAIILYFVGIKMFGYQNDHHENTLYHGTVMHILLHINGVIAMMVV